LYGALLQNGCRFFDKRIGQSTTLTGRQIAKHMAGKVNEIITGEYNHVGKAIIYGDTDSCYFSAYKTLQKDIDKGAIPWTKDTVVQLYDQIGEEVNSTFPQFMLDAFHCPKTRGEVIKAGREIVGSKSLFITKKRYAVLYYDKEGKRSDIDGKPGKIKAMGLDLKRSDTPEFMQNFLSEVLEKVLTGAAEEEVLDMITVFRSAFKARPGWEKGSPKRANNITAYQAKEAKAGKANMPGHVRAAINWNTLKRMMGDKYSMGITDGAKVIVCKVKDNPLGFTSVAYPVDELRLPQWFKDLPFNHDEMESTIIDNKLDNLIGVLNWDIRSTETKNTFNNLFDF
jgi:DNA polymerase elongation subunit (family B)